MEWRHLDVRELEHPEPLERVLEALKELRPGVGILMIHRREPFPLYQILQQRKIPYRTEQLSESLYEIRIGEEAPC